jgi:predicted O-methyltransferase YrrM
MPTDLQSRSQSSASGLVDLLRLRRLVHESIRRGEQGAFDADEKAWLSRAQSQYEAALKAEGTLELPNFGNVRRADRFRRTSVRIEDGRILFALIVALRPECIIELGTSLGASALFMAAALNYLGEGELHTIELNGAAQAIARETIEGGGLAHVYYHLGTFQELLPPLLDRLHGVRFAFIDGHHKERPTWNYFAQFVRRSERPAILVFDDIGWSDEMRRVWKRISEHPAVAFAVSTEKLGIILLGPGD